MARFEDHDDMAIAALDLAVRVQDSAPLEMYRHIAYRCSRDPERMAQILMCLAIWLPVGSTEALTTRAEALSNSRVEAIGRRVHAS